MTGGREPSPGTGGPSSGGGEAPGEPWIETRRGGVFFVNALLIFPHVMFLLPLATRVLVRRAGGASGPSQILDTFPTIAEYLLPRVGFLLLLPLALVVHNLRIEEAPLPRAALWAFLLLHGAALLWGVGALFGLVGPTLPGGP